jgi:hypothetical protein
MRLTVLLAQQLMPGYDATMRDDLARCMNPRAPTVERIDALGRALLVEARAPRGTRALVDVEALHVAGRESWEGDRSGTLARRLYDVVHHAAERGGWWLYRPGRQGPGDDPLSDLSAESEIAADAAPEVARFAVELHPVAAALLRRGVVSPSTLRQVCDELPDPDAYLVRVAYDTLSWRAAVHAGAVQHAGRGVDAAGAGGARRAHRPGRVRGLRGAGVARGRGQGRCARRCRSRASSMRVDGGPNSAGASAVCARARALCDVRAASKTMPERRAPREVFVGLMVWRWVVVRTSLPNTTAERC